MPDKKMRYKLDVEIEMGDKTISMNNKKSKLLQCIDKYGSIAKASEETGIPYRTALKNIEIMETELGSPMVVTKRGGKGGGGSSELTNEGKQVLFEFIKVNRALKKHVDLNEMIGTISAVDNEKRIMKVALGKNEIILPTAENFDVEDDVLISLSPASIFVTLEPHESSVRNTFEGTITKMQFKDDAVRLDVDVGGDNVIADITELSREKLDLNIGKRVFIGFKAVSADIIKID
ncbi:MAG: TOBE domain-containing protein [Methanobacterium sp.]